MLPDIKINTNFVKFKIQVEKYKNAEQIQKELVLYGDNEMRKQAQQLVYSYVPRTPSKRTGNAYRSIKSYYKGKTATISPNTKNAGLSSVDYSIYIEKGNKKTKTPARPYVQTTFTNMKIKLKEIIKKYIS